mmetsp:Transcript_22925/g.32767  ORF Transcript_22925/g.32767 Transcript_22925/m.32767 type:complete len:209 (-) Transcript_22925:992-1618(-)
MNGMTIATIVANIMHHHHHHPVVVPSLSILPTTSTIAITGGEDIKHRHPHDLLLLLLLRRRLPILPRFSIDQYQEVSMILLPCPNLTFYSSHHQHHRRSPTTARVVVTEKQYSTKIQSSTNSSVSSAHTNHPSKWSKWKGTATASSAPSPSTSTATKACTPKYERTASTLWNETYLTFKALLPTKDSISTLLANDRLACMGITTRFKP